MTPSTQGFSWEGFFRSLQGDFMGLAGFVLFIIVVLLIIRWVTGKAEEDSSLDSAEGLLIRKWAGRIVSLLCIVAVVITGWRAATFTVANRLPRADIDRSGTYEQMDALTKRPSR